MAKTIEQLGMSLTRDISGHYSIEVLRESVSRMSDDHLADIDGTTQLTHKMN